MKVSILIWKMMVLVALLVGVLVVAVGVGWVYTATFTDYRAHLHLFFIPAGFVAVGAGGWLVKVCAKEMMVKGEE